MTIKKYFNKYLLIFILFLYFMTLSSYSYASSQGTFELAGTLDAPWAHISSLIPLNNGNAFILQGSQGGHPNRYSIYDAINRKIIANGTLNQRYDTIYSCPKAILLDNGSILIIGSLMRPGNKSDIIPTITYGELYDPTNNELTFTEQNLFPTFSFDMTRLLDGKILIAGGAGSSKKMQIYEPNENKFYQIGNLSEGRYSHSLALLNNGDVLIIGGSAANAEIFDSKTLKITKTVPFQTFSYGNDTKTITLNDGRVFITCIKIYPSTKLSGSDTIFKGFNAVTKKSETSSPGAYMALYNPETQEFKELQFHSKKKIQDYDTTLLNDGRVLITGGKVISGKKYVVLNTAEIFDPKTNKFIPLKNKMKFARFDHSTITLKNGNVLIIGGNDYKKLQQIKEIEIFRPSK